MKKKISPTRVIVLSFLIIIIIGTFLLKMPISISDGYNLSWIDAFFISTSAVCVTGLIPITSVADNFTVIGKIIIALLIQIGGLGFVTIAIFILTLLGAKIGIGRRYLVKEALNQYSSAGLIKLVKVIITTTLIIEFIGFIFNFIVFYNDYPFWNAIGISAFHIISSFNNAGFDILGTGSLSPYQNNVILNINTAIMIILGGIGFIVIHDIYHKRCWKKLSIHSKIVIKMTFFLIVTGTIALKLTEGNKLTWLQAFFQSVTTRTAGFSTVDISNFKTISLLIMIILMFQGASPVSTGGGIKTTTVYTIFKSIVSFAKGKKTITYYRKINDEVKIRAFMLAMLAMSSIFVFTFILLIIEEKNPLYTATLTNILFETTSSFGTVGLSLGITPLLMPSSKIILCFLMFLGRLGPLTIFSLWNRNWNKPIDSNVDYISENIIIG